MTMLLEFLERHRVRHLFRFRVTLNRTFPTFLQPGTGYLKGTLSWGFLRFGLKMC